MPVLPVTHLKIGPSYAVAAAGQHLHVLDSRSGQVLCSADTGLPIRVLAVNDAFEFIVTSADNKKLTVWQREGLKVLSVRDLVKRATDILFDPFNSIVLADKFGDVFRFPLHPAADQASDDASNAELVLGHVSIVNALKLSHDYNFILTADRDEHVRVSWYPEGWNIERYLFGHRKYVSALCVPEFEPSTLISGGGDPALFIWNWQTGELICKLEFESIARPLIRVMANKRKQSKARARSERKQVTGAGDDSQTPEPVTDPQDAHDGEHDGILNSEMLVDEEETKQGPSGGMEAPVELLSEAQALDDGLEEVIAVSKIVCAALNNEKLLLFSLTGSSALFYMSYALFEGTPTIRWIDLGKPIIDFVAARSRVWLSVDINWGDGGATNGVHVLEWNEGQLVEAAQDSFPLLAGLSTCQTPALSPDLDALELYSDLILLPKYDDQGAADEGEDEASQRVSKPRRTGAKAEGRRKLQEALARQEDGNEDARVKRRKTVDME